MGRKEGGLDAGAPAHLRLLGQDGGERIEQFPIGDPVAMVQGGEILEDVASLHAELCHRLKPKIKPRGRTRKKGNHGNEPNADDEATTEITEILPRRSRRKKEKGGGEERRGEERRGEELPKR